MCRTLILHMYVVSTGDVIRRFYFRKEDGNKHQLSDCLHIFSPVCVSQPHADACKYHENFAWPLPSHAKPWSVETVCFTVHYLWIWDDSTLSRHCEDNLPIQIRNRLFSNKTIVLHELSEGERWEEADWNKSRIARALWEDRMTEREKEKRGDMRRQEGKSSRGCCSHVHLHTPAATLHPYPHPSLACSLICLTSSFVHRTSSGMAVKWCARLACGTVGPCKLFTCIHLAPIHPHTHPHTHVGTHILMQEHRHGIQWCQ